MTLAVLPATPLVAANAVAAGYDGSPHPITASATGRDGAPVAGSVTIEYVPGGESPPVAPGTYSATATFHSDDPNYLNAAATTIVTIACAADKERGGKPPAWIRAHCRQRR